MQNNIRVFYHAHSALIDRPGVPLKLTPKGFAYTLPNLTVVWTILSFLETKSRKEGILSVYILFLKG